VSQRHFCFDGIDVSMSFHSTSVVPTDFQLSEIVEKGVGRDVFDNMGPHSGGGTDANHSETVNGKEPGHCLG
jgi:hypothetical protein